MAGSHVTPRTPPLPAGWRPIPVLTGRPSGPVRLKDTFCSFYFVSFPSPFLFQRARWGHSSQGSANSIDSFRRDKLEPEGGQLVALGENSPWCSGVILDDFVEDFIGILGDGLARAVAFQFRLRSQTPATMDCGVTRRQFFF